MAVAPGLAECEVLSRSTRPPGVRNRAMETAMRVERFTYWQDGEIFLGFLNDYPHYCSQGESKEELIENLKSLLEDLKSGEVPLIRKVEEMVVAS
jgi:predicted RNase H-like HicB family nuclease